MPDRFDALRESLLRAGLAPSHVERYLSELAEHRTDIIDHLVALGSPRATAEAEADIRLGGTDALLLPMLADRRFRSLAWRLPALAYLVLPLFGQALFVLAGLCLLILASETPLRTALPDLGSLLAMVNLAIPVVVAWLTLAAAHRRRASLFWPIAGALCGALLAATLNISVLLPQPDLPGEIAVAFNLPALLPLLALSLTALLPISLRT